ncbi:hypothetical protein LZZ85_18390 [Terrimonas sp. NA20]|uniref:DUF4386 domain-containing protein n=1 Tax=Terrimonas ginsenosidimutans TaxID=2908004 RepID=A0ABS9KV88_9BACT|nr:hypothetical protein [Terrimonas ginsenosidimutans]MCG2616274.1 hypothetical protein [Terrimonas ginsenosidimutans]
MRQNTVRLGYVSASIAFIATLGFGIAQLLQVAGVLHYPLDEILIYAFSFCISVPLLVSLNVLHEFVSDNRKTWSRIAISLAICYVVFAAMVYTVQLAVVLPKSHETASSQVLILSPHSLFWMLDGLAYLFMGLAVLFLIPALLGDHQAKLLRLFFLAHGLMTPVVVLEYIYPDFSIMLLFLASPWIISACGSWLLMALYFRKKLRDTQTT